MPFGNFSSKQKKSEIFKPEGVVSHCLLLSNSITSVDVLTNQALNVLSVD